jgi:hypothetical protein
MGALRLERGTKMRVMSIVKVALLAGVVALPASFSAASAKGAKVAIPPGGCAYQKSAVANYAFCSFDCDAATNWCSQQMCTNGALTKVVPCYGTFCAAKCGG